MDLERILFICFSSGGVGLGLGLEFFKWFMVGFLERNVQVCFSCFYKKSVVLKSESKPGQLKLLIPPRDWASDISTNNPVVV